MSNRTSAKNTAGGTGLSSKGLKGGQVGLIGAVVIGISCIAPAYTLTSSCSITSALPTPSA